MSESAKRAWVERVLGRSLAGSGGARKPLLPIWLDAKEAVDARLGKLQASLRGFGDPDLDRIAEYGLYGVTGTSSVGLMTALREADAPGAGDSARSKLAGAIANYQNFLASSKIVQLIDNNAFDVEVGLQQTLGTALTQIERRLGA